MNAVVPLAVPALGAEWKEQGGVYAGVVRGENGAPDYHLIVGPEAPAPAKWKAAVEWAQSLVVDGFKDFALPDRREQRFLFVNTKDLFEPDWYWSGHAELARLAWCQDFDDGNQYYNDQDFKLRARAVRRLPIQ